MDKYRKLKAVAILVCGGFAAGTFADNTAPAANTNDQTMTTNNQSETQVKRNDAAITSDVKSALSTYSGKVTTSVKDGVVSLTGQLPSDTDYDKVITMAESVKGVSDVNVDKLTVKDSSQPLYDSYITAKVKGSLIQSDLMGTDVPSWSISVETKDGQVYLSGKIATEQEKQNIMKVAKSVKGVTKVNDRIVVGPVDSNTTTTTNDTSTGTSDSTAGSNTRNTASPATTPETTTTNTSN